jgi:carbon-monoxide dehydrogenase iron sulfur subunit
VRPKYIACDPAACTGCRLCEFACSLAREGSYDLDLSRIHVARPEPTLSIAVACRLCPDAPCVRACPRSALRIDPDDGVIEVTPTLCTGCGWCIEACDFGAISLDRSTKCVVICDLCRDSGDPACVRGCPKEALSVKSVEAVAAEARGRLVQR